MEIVNKKNKGFKSSNNVAKAFEEQGYKVLSSQAEMVPNNLVEIEVCHRFTPSQMGISFNKSQYSAFKADVQLNYSAFASS